MRPQVVIGFDQGFSANRRSSGFFLGEVQEGELRSIDGPHNVMEAEGAAMLAIALKTTKVDAVAIDAPIGHTPPQRYRAVERLFSLGLFQGKCKPGSCASPTGRGLTDAASRTLSEVATLARFVPFNRLKSPTVEHVSIVEAFPTAAMAVLEDPAALPQGRRGTKTDLYFQHVARKGALGGIVLTQELRSVRNHDQRMALVCGVVAAWYSRGEYTAIGDPSEGYFLMPRLDRWNRRWRNELRRAMAREPRVEHS
jgi:predicted RNase H-like nuclease